MSKSVKRPNVIIAVHRSSSEDDSAFQTRLDELFGLCDAAGANVIDHFVQERPELDAALYLGSGKVEQIAERVKELEVGLVIFDGELSPAQVRNLEARLDCRVIDRTQLILDIFSLRAHSKAGRLQVEIAQLQYLLPRLTGRGVQMSRLGGGIGTRGPGETKLEVDRRRIRERISCLRKELKHIKRIRETQRALRQRGVPTIALVGYTNAGKTSLLRQWTAAKGTAEAPGGHARLFDTLEPTARRVKAGTTGEMVLMDTVGFVQSLPHLLVDAFKSTLEEVQNADVIVQVVDATGDVEAHLQTTYQVLREIGALDKPVITFFNKMDIAKVEPAPDTSAAASVFGSVHTGANLQELYRLVERYAQLDPVQLVVNGHPDSREFWQNIAKSGRVLESTQTDDGLIRLVLQVDRRTVALWKNQELENQSAQNT